MGTPGGRSDFQAIYDACFSAVWRCLWSLGVPEAGMDDAAQEVFVAVHCRLADFEGRSTVKTWVLGIATHVARNHRRRLKRKDNRSELLEDELVSLESDPFEVAAQSERRRVLAALLDELADQKREVLVLAEIEGQTAPEIAEALAIPVNTAYSRLRAARTEFERLVNKYRTRAAGGTACNA